MVCQYSRLGRVSSEKHEIAPDAGAEERGGGISGIGSAMVVMGSYRPLSEPLAVISRMAMSAKALRFITRARSYVYDAVLQRLPQDLQDMAAELGEFIQKAHAMVG
jgi:hypothetical protein